MVSRDLGLALGVCACAAALDVAGSLRGLPLGPRDPALLAALVAGSMGVVGVAFGAARIGFDVLERLGVRLNGTAGAAAATLTIAALFPWLPRSAAGVDPVALIMAASLAAALGVLAALARQGREARHAPALAASGIAAAAGLLAIAWIHFYVAAAARLRWELLVLVCLGFIELGIYRARSRIGSAHVALLLAGLLLAPVAVSHVGTSRTTTSEIPTWPAGRPRHLVLITIDTLRADAVGVLGSGRSDTPNIDRFAREATLFRAARSPAPWTKPSIASLLTGLAPSAHGALETASAMPEGVASLADRLGTAGYRTTAFVANPHLSPEFGFGRGFDAYHTLPGPDLGLSFGAMLLRRLTQRGADSEALTDRGLAWIAEHAAAPFFLWLHYLDPHLPYSPPPRFLAGADVSAIGPSFGDLDGVRTGRTPLSDARKEAIRELYRAEVRYVDHEVGRVLDALRERGLYDDAVVVITSDHGEEFWEHGNFEHGHSLYDELLRIPLVVKRPRSTSGPPCGAEVGRPVSLGSVAATLLEAAGLAVDAGAMSYPSLLRACEIAGELAAGDVSTGTIYYEPRIAVAFEAMKYIRSLGSGGEELYRLDSDAGESVAAAAQCPECLERGRRLVSEHVSRAEELRRRLGLAGGSIEISPETREQLRALGYVE